MKVLYIGYYRDGTGWAHAAQGYILSLDRAGIEVVPRSIKLNESFHSIPKRIEELENNSDKNCDVVIQHVLPHHMDFNGEFDKNIALYVTETDHCKNTAWPERISLLDEAWVPNKFMADEQSINSNILIPHYVVPHAADMDKYQNDYEPLDIPFLKDKFVFYYIGEINRRKNLGALLKAFHLEFGPEEDVGIVIKAHAPGKSEEESENHLSELSSSVKRGLKLYNDESLYHREVFICGYLSDEQIMQMHKTFDCFVSTSFGEAWGIPIFDAMAMGKTPICVDNGGPSDFLSGGGYLADCRKEGCFGVLDSFEELYLGNEQWFSPDINSVRKCMRSAFENKKDKENRSRNGINNAYKYSYASVGRRMEEILSGNLINESYSKQVELKDKHCIKGII